MVTRSPAIRAQSADDAAGVRLLLADAFAAEPEVVGLEEALAQRGDSHGFVAVVDGSIAGHVRLTRGWVDAPEALVSVLVLGPLPAKRCAARLQQLLKVKQRQQSHKETRCLQKVLQFQAAAAAAAATSTA